MAKVTFRPDVEISIPKEAFEYAKRIRNADDEEEEEN